MTSPPARHLGPARPRQAYIAFWALVLMVAALTWPSYNWDIIGYTAVAYESDGLSGPALHAATYDDIRATIPDSAYQLLISKDVYRASISNDPEALAQQLPFYRIRTAYNGLVHAIGAVIGSYSQATILVSAAAAAAIVILSGLLFQAAPRGVFLAVPALVAIAAAFDIARLSTPDALAALAAILLCLAYKADRPLSAAALIIALPFIRTDFILLSLLVCAGLALNRRHGVALLAGTLSLMILFAVNHLSDNYGYAVIFNFTLIAGPQPYPLAMPIAQDMRAYVNAYLDGIVNFLSLKEPYIALIALLANRLQRKTHGENRFQPLLLLSMAFMLLHFALFPAAFARTYFLILWAALMVLAEAAVRPAPATTP